MRNFLKKIISSGVILTLLMSWWIVPAGVSAQTDLNSQIDNNLQEFNEKINLESGGELQVIIINVINVLLGLIGLIYLIITLLAGFKYMTANGDSKKTEDAVQSIKNGAIGIAIILVSGGLVNFVLKTILKALAK